MEERNPEYALGHFIPGQLVDVGCHRDDDRCDLLHRAMLQTNREETLPRDKMFDIIVRSGSRRPVRNTARNNNH